MRTIRRKKAWALAICVLSLTLLGIGVAGKPYAKMFDLAMVTLRLGGIAVLSILVIREWMFGPRDRESLLRKWRRWFTDDYPA